MNLSSIESAIQAFSAGQMIIISDDAERENEGDLVIAADKVTVEAIAFMVRHTTGILCMPMLEERLEELQLPQMVTENTGPRKTAFTVSVDALHGTTTGVSAYDRTATVKALIDSHTRPHDLGRPGHIFPLKYCPGGVLKRAGHTEAAVDLCRLANLYPAAVIGEIVNDDGSMARAADLRKFAETHRIPLISVEEIIRYRRKREKLVHCVSQAKIPTAFGEFTAYVYQSALDGIEHMALVKGEVAHKQNVLVRVHSECLTGDVFGSKRCDCGQQLNLALEKIAQEGAGVLVYLRGHEGRGIGLGHKLRAYTLQEQGRDTVEANLELGFPADTREYGMGAQILADLGLTTIRLLSNNPAKYGGLAGYDLQIVERVPLIPLATAENLRYLQTKQEKLGHLLTIEAK
ncbi:bifunctional 3,4-dihydroxy-2-butanone-4-phosphate synthase/GTP cyclohydrolase II [Parachlamydia sp. AcF125]|uniref:bifunctional 3,4-dihydroxy-2-butanone-4-phosphate synthase/GTP cyclohydrolase II n=1 Tax=Parachlamydia sp. AcF125 TaxID=2795736 RepID=UPI001BCA2742|nr:bifunctional 3,4-dihydroxy-2-butanone-4-phosphate synthase/GTP cyclohydrolase II [Parachlamydia sp. AcF125]MBS4168442.1 Riboflavin biosynthesis protein RibBA [Parachlamydia sp. AcF125]